MRLARYGTLSGFDAALEAVAIPNPFKSGAFQAATLSVPDSMAGRNMRIQIYDIGGTLVRELEGTTWDGKNQNGLYAASGVYLFEVKTDNGRAGGRIIVDAGN
ncbi:MAG: T9SS type A sorting domain-containing protein [Elusimicrobia bacterium]|nr:T9SS type A sorting domain-containing protein [Elusimicrobiota bacterium]